MEKFAPFLFVSMNQLLRFEARCKGKPDTKKKMMALWRHSLVTLPSLGTLFQSTSAA